MQKETVIPFNQRLSQPHVQFSLAGSLRRIVPSEWLRRWYQLRFEMTKYRVYVTRNEWRLSKLKGIHAGRRCFIIGNGPSLKITDLNRLKNEITFAANKIYLAFKSTDWRPTYYAVTDDMVAQQNFDEINQLTGFVKLFPYQAITQWNTAFKDALFFRYRYYNNRFPEPPQFSFDITYRVYAGRTVIYPLIQVASYMGIREIYLLGIDFHFSMPSEKHGRILVADSERNHFHPDYRKPGEIWIDPKLNYQEKAFVAAEEALRQRGGKIYNATRGGKLEVFPRVDLDELI